MRSKRKPKARAKQPGTMRTKPQSTSTVLGNSALDRSLNLLSDLRRGRGSYSELLRAWNASRIPSKKFFEVPQSWRTRNCL